MSFILIFDIPKEMRTLELKVNRFLHSINARMLQHSVWKSTDLNQLMDVAMLIKSHKGKASILEEKLIF
jgi:hypothetical protein